MPRACSICTDRRREEIDAMLLSGASVAKVIREFDYPDTTMRRHKADHLSSPASIASSRPAALMSSIEFLQARDEDLAVVQQMAVTRGHTQGAVAALAQRIKIGLEIANIRGEVMPKPRTILHVALDKESAARIAQSYMRHEELSNGETIDAR